MGRDELSEGAGWRAVLDLIAGRRRRLPRWTAMCERGGYSGKLPAAEMPPPPKTPSAAMAPQRKGLMTDLPAHLVCVARQAIEAASLWPPPYDMTPTPSQRSDVRARATVVAVLRELAVQPEDLLVHQLGDLADEIEEAP